MTQKPILVFVPFSELVEELEPLKDCFWFLECDLKTLISIFFANFCATDGFVQKSLDVNSLMQDLYGQNLEQFLIYEFHAALERLDRCNASLMNKATQSDEALIRLVAHLIDESLKKKFEKLLGEEEALEVSPDIIPFWNRDSLVFAIKK